MSKFIRSRTSFEFDNPETGESVRIPREYLGEVPDWVTKTPLYKLATSGKNPQITTVGNDKPKAAPAAPGISEEEKTLRAKAKTLKIPDYGKLPLVELALAVDKAENPDKYTVPPAADNGGKGDQPPPPEN